jgi:hypothetical protein
MDTSLNSHSKLSIVANLLNKRIDDVNRRLDKIEEDIREIRQLSYKFFEVLKKESE